jgi:iron complex outermembrane receptor protein
MREKNRQASGIVNGLPDTVQTGKARTRGVELEAVASLNRRVDVVASYTYLDARVMEGAPGEAGKRLASVPKHTAALWTNVKFKVADVPGFVAGAGVRFVGGSYDGKDQHRVSSVTLVDAMLGYDRGPYRFALNVANLFDREFLSTCLARGDCYYGARRTVIGSVTYRF